MISMNLKEEIELSQKTKVKVSLERGAASAKQFGEHNPGWQS